MTVHHDDHGDDHEEYEDDLACQHQTAKVVAMFWSSYPCRLQNSQINFRIKCPDTGSTFPLNKPFLSPHDTNWKKGQRSGGHLIQGCVKTRSNVWYVLTQELLWEMRLHICQQPSGLWFTSYKMEKLGTHCRFTTADIRRHWVALWCKKKAGNREECNRPDDGRSFDNGSQVDGSPHTIQAFHWVTGTKLGNLNGL